MIRRSILLMNRVGLTLSFSACFVTVSVWTIISSTASMTMIVPSVALRARVTFPVKSTWPGVSMRLMRVGPVGVLCSRLMLAVLIVMPRRCSSWR